LGDASCQRTYVQRFVLFRETWRNVRYAKQKVNEDHITAICEAYPEYRLWIETGDTEPNSGQISPTEKNPAKKA